MPVNTPLATYRIQFSPDFGFDQALVIPAYLADLGAGALYASPVWEARPGSRHGYDTTDPAAIRGELGGHEAFVRLAAELRQRGLGLVLDIVPNHMAATAANPWWRDVLEHGPASPYSRYFDIDWESGPGGRLVLPALAGPLDEAIDSGELSIDSGPSGLVVRYRGNGWPLDIKSYPTALAGFVEDDDLARLVQETGYLPGWRVTEPTTRPQRRAAALEIKRRWIEFLAGHPGSLRLDSKAVRAILEEQPYCLTYWREGLTRINYRRFFDIADLVALCAGDPEVFDAVHRLPLQLVQEGLATGLRIDHIDGLLEPAAYLEKLSRRLIGPDGKRTAYLVVEKVLDADEELPPWPVDGTTGYDYLNAQNGLFVDPAGVALLHDQYARLTGDRRPYPAIAMAEKSAALRELFPAECERLAGDLADLAVGLPEATGVTREQLSAAIVLVTAALPVYRTFARGAGLSQADARHLRTAFDAARRAGDGVTPSALGVLERVLLGESVLSEQLDEAARQDFVARWQLLTGPATAKGVEDTALFSYTPFVPLNEVGGDPSGGHCSIELFHALNASRAQTWPRAMNATTTHDTKRSEDVRARLNSISELASEWTERVTQWMSTNAPSRATVDGMDAPGPADELLFYQSLAGIRPLDDHQLDGMEARLVAFMVKACREAKKRSSWMSPNQAYEAAVARFVGDALHGAHSGAFAASFLPLHERIAFAGAVNSLSQVVLKVGSPGLPDFYQGSELWDFALTDPDNRRAVAFDRRALEMTRLLEQLPRDRSHLCNDVLGNWRDGRVKLFTTAQALRTRAALRETFEHGSYIPIAAEGERAANVCAFLRVFGPTWVLVAVPRLVARLTPPGQWPLGGATWGRTGLVLPKGAPALWGNGFTGSVVQAGVEDRILLLASVFAGFPVAMLRGI